MKKLLTTLLFFAFFITFLVGCNQEPTANIVAKDLDSNLHKLTVAVNKLDTIDNRHLSNPDIYSSTSLRKNDNKFFALAFNPTTPTREIVKQSLIDAITNKLNSQNSCYDCNDGISCKKYCDDNGNCYYSDCNGNNYCYKPSGECTSCDNIPEQCSYVGETILSGSPRAIDTELVATQLSTIDENSTNDANNTITEKPSTYPMPRPRIYYFTQDSFSPVKLKYNPRFVSQYNENTINDQIDNYLFKVQKLYAMSEDSIEANNILQSCKFHILDAVKEINDLNSCILNGNCEPSIQQLQALRNYISDIKTTTRRLKDCNGELSEELNNINESDSNSMIDSVDVMSSNYMRLINHIDTRITYHKSAIATLEQIKYLLDGAINNDKISEEEIENIIENITTEKNENIENNENEVIKNNQEVVDNYKDMIDNNDKVIDNNNTVSDSNIENSDTNTNVYDNIVQDDKIENNEENIENNDILVNNLELKNNENISEELNNEEYNNTTTDNNVENQETNNGDNIEETQSDNKLENEENTVVENNNKTSTIDSYNEVQSWSNIDTYKNEDDANHDDEIMTLEEPIIDDENIDTIDENNTIINNTTSDNQVVSNDNNVITNTPIVNGNNVTGTTNNGIYHNSVITQNNLNTDNGYGGYYYTADGEIKNNGMNNNGEIGNNGNTIENNLNGKNNVNTYGYNTMLDIINQGTVNNGINTL